MTYEEMVSIVSNIAYRPGWAILIGKDRSERPFVQIAVSEESEASLSPFTGKRETWKSGKPYLSPHMCRQEVVGAVFGTIKAAEDHEMKEWFRYKNASIYNPHLDSDALAELARKKVNFNLRENAMSMEE
jgi:hypothetical protein